MKAQSNDLACIVLAAGKGTRMKSAHPKVMHALAHKPMLYHVLDTARALGADRVVLVTSPDMEKVRTHVTAHYKESVSHAVQEQQLGTGDAVKAAAELEGFNGTVLILYGDTPLIRLETLRALLAALKADKKAGLGVLGMEVSQRNAYGRLLLDKQRYVERIVETKDASEAEKSITLCFSGVMAVRGPLLFPLLAKLTHANAQNEYYLTDVVALARADGHPALVAQAPLAELAGINSRAELAVAEIELQRRLRRQVMENGATLLDPETVYFSHDTQIGQDVVIQPHVVFGPGVKVESNVEIRAFSHIEGARILSGATVGPFARLRPGALIGEKAHIGNFVEIKQTTVERGAKVNHLSYIGDAHIGRPVISAQARSPAISTAITSTAPSWARARSSARTARW